MLKPLLVAALPALLLAACATTAPSAGTGSSPLAAVADEAGLPPLASPARIPDSGSLGQRVAAWRGGSITADVHLCVAPDGKVSDVQLARSSGMAAFDRAVVDGAGTWNYQPFVSHDAAPRCEDVAVAYVVE